MYSVIIVLAIFQEYKNRYYKLILVLLTWASYFDFNIRGKLSIANATLTIINLFIGNLAGNMQILYDVRIVICNSSLMVIFPLNNPFMSRI